ncbi:uncharacterized protein NECHADRAFT_77232 [Fusarium vanettenii 77-13-4]|uniref:Uncharacterized protein n=1 Tax=Fusarium vanettenii (strain ATCC MYA-4622 / CBS 123669 / FGSC 9596 / NRRL 45880 / 77-13-4) TaxID=660122 RepID=C7ZJE8_FUSV7|nr:uncharacterized protein NECHADRAFT_77232 [Fusarium vanettenii 77-13-4]EEU35892.1 predicted protein [Fusarium vanettenii 77-13-4]
MQPSSRRPAEAKGGKLPTPARVCIISDGVHEPFSDARCLGGVGVPWGSTSYGMGHEGEGQKLELACYGEGELVGKHEHGDARTRRRPWGEFEVIGGHDWLSLCTLALWQCLAVLSGAQQRSAVFFTGGRRRDWPHAHLDNEIASRSPSHVVSRPRSQPDFFTEEKKCAVPRAQRLGNRVGMRTPAARGATSFHPSIPSRKPRPPVGFDDPFQGLDATSVTRLFPCKQPTFFPPGPFSHTGQAAIQPVTRQSPTHPGAFLLAHTPPYQPAAPRGEGPWSQGSPMGEFSVVLYALPWLRPGAAWHGMVRAGPPGENASESATEITAQRHALTPDSPDFEPIRPATIVTGTRNRALSCTSPGRNVRANEGSSDGTTLWSKLIDQSSQQPRKGAGIDWIGICITWMGFRLQSPFM